MKVADYYITWEYRPMKSDSKPRYKTICTIWTDRGDTKLVIAHGLAVQSEGDNHNRDKARKVSLEHALKIGNFGKTYRKTVWETYRTLTKEPRWKLREKRRPITCN